MTEEKIMPLIITFLLAPLTQSPENVAIFPGSRLGLVWNLDITVRWHTQSAPNNLGGMAGGAIVQNIEKQELWSKIFRRMGF